MLDRHAFNPDLCNKAAKAGIHVIDLQVRWQHKADRQQVDSRFRGNDGYASSRFRGNDESESAFTGDDGSESAHGDADAGLRASHKGSNVVKTFFVCFVEP
jgi:hypothetical protein